jgi:lipopolysaccharide transport system ATP-binding protein
VELWFKKIMSNTVISVENLTKRYDLGVIGTGTLSRDLNRWWANFRKQPDPYTKIGQEDKYKRRGESILALDDISFTVEQGEALGIIGKNGAGKSTLLKILSRVTAPTSGLVKVRGRIGSLLEVGTGFHPELTGRENVFLNGAILGMRKDEVQQKFDEIVDFSGVEKFIDTPVKRYSSGMYVRLAFAVAAHLDPEILVVDEVLAVGDAEFQKKCLGKMGDVASEGRTILFVSHNMGAIQQLCRSAIVIDLGRVYYKGQADDSINAYLSTIKGQPAKLMSGPLVENKLRNFQLKRVTYTNDKEKIISSIPAGDNLHINLFMHSEEIIKKLVVSLGINDNYGNRLTVLHSKLAGFNLEYKKDQKKLTCVLKNLKLLPGKYIIDIKIYDDTDTLIWLNNATELIVESGNILRTGKLPSKDWGGYFVMDHEWIA